MLENKQDDTFLSRWINNELSAQELEAFKKHPEYLHYQKIKHASGLLDTSDYNHEEALGRIKAKIAVKKKKPVIQLWPFYASVAASIAIILGVFFFFDSSVKTITADGGEAILVALPDGSEMLVNKKSTASFDEKTWDDDRSITLDGEAYFKVQKGSTFTVKTSNGDVTVLGTQFNVNAVQKMIEVVCYEGKVKVETEDDEMILKPTMGMLKLADTPITQFTTNELKPEWLSNKSVFRSIPIKYVFIELEKQYKINIIAEKNVNQKEMYTGSFPHDNLTIALQTVFSTLGLKYTLSADNKTLVVDNK